MRSPGWPDPSLVQLWGPRYNVFVVAACDLPVFSLGTLPEDARGLSRAMELAARLHAVLDGARMRYGEAGHALGVNPNSLRYAAATGTVLIPWEGARLPVIWTVPPLRLSPGDARLELARRYLHVYGPATPETLRKWAGISLRSGGSVTRAQDWAARDWAALAAQSAVRSRSRRSGARRVAIMIWTASWTSLVSWWHCAADRHRSGPNCRAVATTVPARPGSSAASAGSSGQGAPSPPGPAAVPRLLIWSPSQAHGSALSAASQCRPDGSLPVNRGW